MQLSTEEIAELTRLEHAMWTASLRYDRAFQHQRFATDFFEFGRSGKVYSRSESLIDAAPALEIQAHLDNLQIRRLDTHTVQVTYHSHQQQEDITLHARRSSIWSLVDGIWVMRFHQGTPYEP